MKHTTIKIQEDMLTKINLYKYKFGLKNHDQVIRRLFEICSKIDHAQSASKEVKDKDSQTSGGTMPFDKSLAEKGYKE